MQSHTELSDSEFIRSFESAKMPEEIFNHEAHLRLAWLYIHQFGCETAILKTETSIMNFVRVLNAEHIYHTTLTIAAVKVVNHFVQKSNSQNFNDFILEFPRLKSNFKNLIEAHYSFDIFSSADAKSTYIEPDLLPFE